MQPTDGVVTGPARAVLFGFSAADREAVADELERLEGPPTRWLLTAAGAVDAAPAEARLIATGSGVTPEEAAAWVTEILTAAAPARSSAGGPAALVLAAGDDLRPFEALLAADRLFFITARPPSTAETACLLRSAARTSAGAGPAGPAPADSEAVTLLLALERRLAAATTASEAAQRLAAGVTGLLPEAAAVRCLVVEPRTQALAEPAAGGGWHRHSAALGLLAYAVRTGMIVDVEHPADAPLYDADLDGPPDVPLIAVPLTGEAGAGEDGAILGVLAVSLRSPLPPMGRRRLTAAVRRGSHAFTRIALAQTFAETTRGTALFRPQALEARGQGLEVAGSLLDVGPEWVRWTFRLLMAFFVAAVLFLTLFTREEYVEGPALIQVEGRTDVHAPLGGAVVEVPVAVGDQVAPGQPLARFYGAGEAAEAESLEAQLAAAVVERLRAPERGAGDAGLADLRGRWLRARARLEELTLRAPAAGTVVDLRARPEQIVAPGDRVATLRGASERPRVLALLPGSSRPQLTAGMPLRLSLDGYPQAVAELAAAHVGDAVVAPEEAARLLPRGAAGSIRPDGPSLLVEGDLPSDRFRSGGEIYQYFDGMTGTVEAAVHRERLLFSLLPGLRSFGGPPSAPPPAPPRPGGTVGEGGSE